MLQTINESKQTNNNDSFDKITIVKINNNHYLNDKCYYVGHWLGYWQAMTDLMLEKRIKQVKSMSKLNGIAIIPYQDTYSVIFHQGLVKMNIVGIIFWQKNRMNVTKYLATQGLQIDYQTRTQVTIIQKNNKGNNLESYSPNYSNRYDNISSDQLITNSYQRLKVNPNSCDPDKLTIVQINDNYCSNDVCYYNDHWFGYWQPTLSTLKKTIRQAKALREFFMIVITPLHNDYNIIFNRFYIKTNIVGIVFWEKNLTVLEKLIKTKRFHTYYEKNVTVTITKKNSGLIFTPPIPDNSNSNHIQFKYATQTNNQGYHSSLDQSSNWHSSPWDHSYISNTNHGRNHSLTIKINNNQPRQLLAEVNTDSTYKVNNLATYSPQPSDNSYDNIRYHQLIMNSENNPSSNTNNNHKSKTFPSPTINNQLKENSNQPQQLPAKTDTISNNRISFFSNNRNTPKITDENESIASFGHNNC